MKNLKRKESFLTGGRKLEQIQKKDRRAGRFVLAKLLDSTVKFLMREDNQGSPPLKAQAY